MWHATFNIEYCHKEIILRLFTITFTIMQSFLASFCGPTRVSKSERTQVVQISFLVGWQSKRAKGVIANKPNQ